MTYFILILLPVLIFSVIGIAILPLFENKYSVEEKIHEAMTKKYTSEFGIGCFESFLREFKATNWDRDPAFEESFFCVKTKSQIHAGIICFNGKGMVLKGKDYKRFKEFIVLHRLNINAIQNVDWKCIK